MTDPVEAPDYLSTSERVVWLATRELMRRMTPTLLVALEAYAIEIARWRDADEWVRIHGTTITLRTDKGEVRQVIEAPQLRIARAAQIRALKLAPLLGLAEKS